MDKQRGAFPLDPEQGSGQLVNSKYSDYVSYPPRDNQDIAIPTYELTQEQLDKLHETYIIAQDFTPEVMKGKIKDVMYPIVDNVLEGNHKGFIFDIPSNKEKLEYSNDLCFPLLKRGKKRGGNSVTRDFYSGTSTHTAAKTTWALKAIFDNLDSELVGTLRDLFYRRSLLFRDQEASNRTVTDICYMFGCTRRSLNITSEEKGWVCGKKMEIKLDDGTTLNCSHKVHIPDERKIAEFSYDPEMKYILVVEKGTIFNYLERFKFHDIQNCAIITANGSPDVSTRRFLKWLEMKTKLPVIGVADGDPAGLEIMRCYSQGSANLALENLNLSVPSLRWVGIPLYDIEEIGLELNDYNSEVLCEKDIRTLNSLLTDKYTKLSPRWKQAANKMLAVRRKVSFEMMHEKGYRHVADSFLPKIINRTMDVEEPAAPQ